MANWKNVFRKSSVRDEVWPEEILEGYWIAKIPGRIVGGLFLIFFLALLAL